MTQSLPQVAHEHHDRINQHIDALPAQADRMLVAGTDEIRATIAATGDFIGGTLIPHVDAAERTLYPELERMFQNRHSMAPMRREHDELRRLAAEYLRLGGQLRDEPVTLSRTLGVRRVMFQLYALVKIHLAEEDVYLRIVERGVPVEVADVLAAALEHPIAR